MYSLYLGQGGEWLLGQFRPGGQRARHESAASWQQQRLALRGYSGAGRLVDVVGCFCLALAEPHLKYCTHFWDPECVRDVGKWEGAEQRDPRLAGAGGLAPGWRDWASSGEMALWGCGTGLPAPAGRFLRRQSQAHHWGMWQESEILVIN